MYYRYKNVDLYIQGIEDFLKGPGWLMEQDGEMLHQQVMASGYRAEEPDKLGFHFSYPMFEDSGGYEEGALEAADYAERPAPSGQGRGGGAHGCAEIGDVLPEAPGAAL